MKSWGSWENESDGWLTSIKAASLPETKMNQVSQPKVHHPVLFLLLTRSPCSNYTRYTVIFYNGCTVAYVAYLLCCAVESHCDKTWQHVDSSSILSHSDKRPCLPEWLSAKDIIRDFLGSSYVVPLFATRTSLKYDECRLHHLDSQLVLTSTVCPLNCVEHRLLAGV